MRLQTVTLLTLALIFTLSAFAADPVTPLVQSEYAKMQVEFQTEMAKARKQLQDLAQQRNKALQEAETQARLERGGIEMLKRYDIVIVSRYVNDQGEYQSGLEINPKDVENINQMFQAYMHSSPLFGRVSAGEARRSLEWGIQRLEELSKLHSSPTEVNYSPLEIIAKQTKDAETTIKTVTLLAGRLGVSLTQPIARAEESTSPKSLLPFGNGNSGNRAPASQAAQIKTTTQE